MVFFYTKKLKDRIGLHRVAFQLKGLLSVSLILLGVTATSNAWAVPSYKVVYAAQVFRSSALFSDTTAPQGVALNNNQALFKTHPLSYVGPAIYSTDAAPIVPGPFTNGFLHYDGYGLNNKDQVAGSVYDLGVPAIFSNGEALLLGKDSTGEYRTFVMSVNEYGQAQILDPSTGQEVLLGFGPLPPSISLVGGDFFGINDKDQVTGQVNGNAVVFNFDTNQMTDLGSGIGYAINNNGQAVGTFGFYDPATGKITPLGGTGYAINANGLATGSFGLYNANTGETVSLGGTGVSINQRGDVVGSNGNGIYGGFLYHNGTVYDFNSLIKYNDLGYVGYREDNIREMPRELLGINDKGWIFGRASDGYSFIAIPVPLPSSLALLSLGLGLLGMVSWCQARREV